MSRIYQTQPKQYLKASEKAIKRYNSITKQFQDTKRSLIREEGDSTDLKKIYTQSMDSLAHTDNPYLLRKIRGFVKNVQNMARKKLKTQEPSSSLFGNQSKSSSKQQSLRNSFKLQNLQRTVQRAYIINQSQKLERLISKYQYDNQKFNTLSQRIKAKLIPGKVKVASYECNIRPMQKYTWYKKWSKCENGQKSRMKIKLLQKMKNTEQDNRKNYFIGKYGKINRFKSICV